MGLWRRWIINRQVQLDGENPTSTGLAGAVEDWANAAWLQLLAELEKHGIDKWAAELEKAKADPLVMHGDTTDQPRDPKTGRMLGYHGGHRKPGGDFITSGSERGTNRHYLLARIARDCPDLLNEIGPGKTYRSARAAAIAAGIVKDVPTVRLTEPSRIAEALWAKLSREELAMLVAALTERLTAADWHKKPRS